MDLYKEIIKKLVLLVRFIYAPLTKTNAKETSEVTTNTIYIKKYKNFILTK